MPPPFDAAKFAEVTGITAQNSELLVWINVKTTNDKFYLREGDEFTVGNVKYKVVKIDLHDAVISGEGKSKQLHIGDNLRDAPMATEPVEQQEPPKEAL
jgi:hypothetical protein